MNKAQMQIHWIFVIAAGSIILLFFFGFGLKYKDLETTKLNVAIAKHIESSVLGLKTGEQFKTVKLNEKTKIDFSCNEFKINNDFKYDWSENIVFSPDVINSDKFVVWTKKVQFPYGVDNVVIISDLSQKIYLIDSEFSRAIKSLIPNDFTNVQLIQFDDLQDLNFKGSDNIKIVSFSESNSLNNYENKAEILYIDPGDNGRVLFTNGDYNFLDRSMIFAAIFSSNNSYSCSYNKLIKKIVLITDVYYYKARYLQDCCSNFRCSYADFADVLSRFSDSVKNKDINNVNTIKSELISKNEDLFRKDCKAVF